MAGGGNGAARCQHSDRLQPGWQSKFLKNGFDLLHRGVVGIFRALAKNVGGDNNAHQAEAVIEDDERARDHQHHFWQSKIIARMNCRFPLEKSDYVIADESDRSALKMGNVIARKEVELAENFFQFAERIGRAACGNRSRFVANGQLLVALTYD